jgi:hypothetical protein
MKLGFIAAAILVLGLAAPAGAQTLTLQGLAGGPKTITAAQFAALPHVKLQALEHGRPRTFEGVQLLLLMTQVDAPWGDLLTGKDMIDVVRATAKDGYRVVYSIGEIDPGTSKSQIIVADKVDGIPLDSYAGPYEIIVENDLRPGRWLRQANRFELIQIK